jgi:hypothetical protein
MLTFHERILLELLADGVSTTSMAWILRAPDSERDLQFAEKLIELDLLFLQLKMGATTTAGMLAASFRRGLIE